MKTQQCIVLLSALATSLLGLGLVLVAKCLMQPDIVLQQTEPRFAPALLTIGTAVCTAGCLGAIGSCCSSRALLCLFGVVTLATAIAGVLAGGVLLATVNEQGEELKRSCIAMTEDSHQTSSGLTSEYQQSYDSMDQALANCRQNDRPDALGLQDCGQLGKDDDGVWYAEDPRSDLFEWLEEHYGCGGFCLSGLPLFAFPEHSGPPVDQSSKLRKRPPCFHGFASELEFRGNRAAGLVLVLSLPLFMVVCLASWIVCYPPPNTRKNYVHQAQDSEDMAESDRLLADEGAGSDGEYQHR